MSKTVWEVELLNPLDHNGEEITKIGFRDMNGDDIANGKIDAELMDNSENDDFSFKNTITLARSIASTLSVRPKLGANGGKLTIPDYVKIVDAWGKHFEAQMNRVTEEENKGAGNTDNPPPLASSPIEE